jgi:hypothetical protein
MGSSNRRGGGAHVEMQAFRPLCAGWFCAGLLAVLLTPSLAGAGPEQSLETVTLREVSGVVVDALAEGNPPIAGAGINFATTSPHPPSWEGWATADDDGVFNFSFFANDLNWVHVSASAAGYQSRSHRTIALDLTHGFLEIRLTPMRGAIELSPSQTESLPCDADVSVLITNSSLVGEPLTILWLTSVTRTEAGAPADGFTLDLAAIGFPLTLQAGEHVNVPVRYRAARQPQSVVELELRLRSTAASEETVEKFHPYRGLRECAAATPAPTATAGPTPCPGDCNGDGAVTIDELVREIESALDQSPAADCNADLDASGAITINEMVVAVAAALAGCATL